MNKLQKVRAGIIVSAVFIIMCSFSILSDFENYYSFYKRDRPKILDKMEVFSKWTPIDFFGKYTGFETGYGFFGPNVSSDFVFNIRIYDEKGNIIKQLNEIPTNSKEGKLRLSCMNNMFLDKLDKIDERHDKYLDIVMKQVAIKIKKDHPKSRKVELKMYLFDYPSIKNFNKQSAPRIAMIKKYEV